MANREELERAIVMIQDAAQFYLGNGMMTGASVELLRSVTLEALRSALSRQENAPKCDGCVKVNQQRYGGGGCQYCNRDNGRTDLYEPKGEKE